MEIEDYCIIKRGSISELEKRVRDLLHKGWMPQGSIAIESMSYSNQYYQSMIKPKPPEKEKHVTI